MVAAEPVWWARHHRAGQLRGSWPARWCRVVALFTAVCVVAAGAGCAAGPTYVRTAHEPRYAPGTPVASVRWVERIHGSRAGMGPLGGGEREAIVIVRALDGAAEVARWAGYGRWDGEMPARFDGTVRGGTVVWGHAGELRLGLGVAARGGRVPVGAWMPRTATTLVVMIVPGPAADGAPAGWCSGRAAGWGRADTAGSPRWQRAAWQDEGDGGDRHMTGSARARLRREHTRLAATADMAMLIHDLERLEHERLLEALHEQLVVSSPLTRDHERVRVAARIVLSVSGCIKLSLAEIAALPERLSWLSEADRRALVAYATEGLGLEAEVDGLQASVRGAPTGAESQVTAAATGTLQPLPWASGKQPVYLYVGNEAHRLIGLHYANHHRGDSVVLNHFPIASILERLAKLGIGPATNRDAKAIGALNLRPDITNLTTGEIYEIKNFRDLTTAERKLAIYRGIFARSGVSLKPGASTAAGASGIVAAPGGHYIFWSPAPGIILYRYRRGAFVPVVPVPAPQPQEQPQRQRATGHQQERKTEYLLPGLTALLLYLLSRGAIGRPAPAGGMPALPDDYRKEVFHDIPAVDEAARVSIRSL